jgi:hypothetical protein
VDFGFGLPNWPVGTPLFKDQILAHSRAWVYLYVAPKNIILMMCPKKEKLKEEGNKEIYMSASDNGDK